MRQDTDVDFDPTTRAHIGLQVADRDRSIAFYRALFGVEPTKVRPGYAKFEPADPPLNLSLSERTMPAGAVRLHFGHYGIQVRTADEVARRAALLRDAGLRTTVEEDATCCYAVQTRVWVTDPDGIPWEVFVVLDADSTERFGPASSCCTGQAACCESGATDCCGAEVV